MEEAKQIKSIEELSELLSDLLDNDFALLDTDILLASKIKKLKNKLAISNAITFTSIVFLYLICLGKNK
jgi:hypothetical protein